MLESSNSSCFSRILVVMSAVILTILFMHTAAVSSEPSGKLMAPVLTDSHKYLRVKRILNSSVILNCSSIGNPKPIATWYFKNKIFTDGKFFKNGSIKLSHLKRAHSGQWYCFARNSVGVTRSGLISLITLIPATVSELKVTPSERVSKGTKVTALCSGYGTSPRKTKWFLNGKRMLTDYEGYNITLDQDMVFIPLNRSATVKCLYYNDYGNSSREKKILVYDGDDLLWPPTTPTPMTTTTRPPIRCQRYTGTACSNLLLPGHKWAYDTSVDSESTSSTRESEIAKIFDALDGAVQVSESPITPVCARGMKSLLCGRVFPVCPGASLNARDKPKPRPLCREHCEAVQSLFCRRISASSIWSALRDMGLPSKMLQRYLDRDTPLCKGLPPAVPPQAAGVEISSKPSVISHCTMVDFEAEWRRPDVETQRAKNRCFVNRGQLYNGTEHRARLSPDTDKLLACARWNDTRVASALLRKGYSVVAFPSLRSAGRSCRNPAGLQERPFCVPENPTVREVSLLVPCNLFSCLEYHEIQNRENRDEITILGIAVNKQRLTLAVVILIVILVLVILLISYCVFCLCISRPTRGRRRAPEDCGPGNGPFLEMASSIDASIASEFDPTDAKSLLLTPNQDYLGKALSEFISPQLQKLEYPRTDIKDITEIGQGAFGEVYLVEAKNLDVPNKHVAMKVLKNDAAPDLQIQFLREATLLADLNHENIVKLHGISLVYKPFCMLLEYMCHGDLNSFLRRHGPHENGRHVHRDPIATAVYHRPGLCNGHVLSNGSDIYIQMLPKLPLKLDRVRLCKMAVDISEGMIYLSHRNYVHRDLASRNCLMDADLNVKIADFGLCRHIRRGEDFIDDDHGAMPIRWMPLESILERRFNLDTDVWSFGVLLWELFSFASQPYHGKGHDEIIEFLQKGSYLDKPDAAPDNVYRLMLRCWSQQRRERPTFAWLMRQLSELLRRWTENERET